MLHNIVLPQSPSLQNFSQTILYHCYPQSRKEKIVQGTPKNFLEATKTESLAPISNKLKLEFKPCLKPLFASSKVSQSTSSTVSLNSDVGKLK